MERASHQVTRGEPEMRWGNTCPLYGCWGPQGNTKREKNGGGGIRGGEQGRFRGSEVWNCLVRFSCHAFLML
jgi:hypothetical protein